MIDPRLCTENCDTALFLAVGGGGDTALASTLALSYERCCKHAVIGSIIWERYTVDPVPGPISIDELINVVHRGEGYAIINSDTIAIRGSRVVVPQAARAAKVLKKNIVVFDLSSGAVGLAKAIENYMNGHGIKTIIGVDVGGDSLAEGFEDNLWSPLADAVSVAALAHIKESYLAVACPGADGELQPSYIEEKIRRIARLGGYLGGYVLSSKDLQNLKNILDSVISEASSIPFLTINTNLDKIKIRNRSREVRLSLLNLVVFILDAITVARDSAARYVYGTHSLDEARWIFNKLGIVTEYDLEEEIFKYIMFKGSYIDIDMTEIKNRIKNRLLEMHKPIR